MRARRTAHRMLGFGFGWGVVLSAATAAPAAIRGERPHPLFHEIGASALPGVETVCGSPEKNYILEVNGGGVLLGDFDGDGKCDVVIVDGSTIERAERYDKGERGRPPRLFLGRGDCTFAPAGEAWKMNGGRWGMGGAVGDLNGDGWLDLVITEWGPSRVFLNDGGKGFTEITAKAGLVGQDWSTSAALFDFDNDGVLDLAIANYLDFDTKKIASAEAGACTWKGRNVMCGPQGLTPEHDRLYRGKGDGTFEEVTVAARFRPDQAGFGLGILPLDYDGDGDTDLFVGNDSSPNFLWENQGDGTFKEVGFARGVSLDANGKAHASMGIAAGDLNGDGRPDLFLTGFSGENNVLYTSWKKNGFRERSSIAGLAGPSIPLLGWGTTMADFDLDGDLDLSVMNGHVYPQADEPGTDTSYAQIAQLYVNDGAGHFAPEALSDAKPLVARASAAADLDGDGDLDIVCVCVEGQVRVFRNDTPHGASSHWLRVALRSKSKNRFGLGARVAVEWTEGAEKQPGRQLAEIRTAGGFQSAVPAEAHFGLGPVSRIEKLTVRWPSRREQVLENVAVDRVLTIEEPEK